MHLLALGAFRHGVLVCGQLVVVRGLNAPFGARCFLTGLHRHHGAAGSCVLMHLMALGAF